MVLVSFRCPHCALALVDVGPSLRCESGHVFDRAREGYVNLMVGGRLAGGPAGDDEAMVRSRRAVFDAGLYLPIMDAVAASVATITASVESPTVLDAGCGEGSYLARAVDSSGAEGWGIDIAKTAVRLASKRHRHHRYAVASSYRLPFFDDSFDALIDVFSPRPWDELARVLVPGGAAIIVTPGAGHLAQLKERVYTDPREHRERIDPDEPGPLVHERSDHVAFTLDLDDPTLRLRLLEMTPYWWSTDPSARAAVAAEVEAVDVDVVVSVFRRVG
jgi:23S rRNA (guanine745-N1)-methyltransferase